MIKIKSTMTPMALIAASMTNIITTVLITPTAQVCHVKYLKAGLKMSHKNMIL